MAKETLTVKCRISNSTEKNCVVQFYIPAPASKSKNAEPGKQLAKTVILLNTTDLIYGKQFEPGKEYKLTIE